MAVAAGAAAFASPAQTISAAFNVQVTLNSACRFNSGPGNVTMSYTAFQATVATASTTMQVQCTTELPYQVSLSSTNPSALTAPGNLNGLSYTVSLPAAPTGGYKGSGASVSHTVSVSIPAGQSGSCASTSCQANQSHTVYVVY